MVHILSSQTRLSGKILGLFCLLTSLPQICLSQQVTIDSSFGENGFEIISFYDRESINLVGAVIQSDDKIFLAGLDYHASDLLFMRTLSNGEIDNSYGDNGMTVLYSDSNHHFQEFKAFAMGDDGSSIAGITANAKASLIKIDQYGELDTSFGLNGFAEQNFPVNYYTASITDLLIQSDNKILFCGTYTYYDPGTTRSFFTGRCLPDGTPDPTFGNNGLVMENFGFTECRANIIFQQHDNKILVGGTANNDFALVRYNQYGELDATFGNNGIFTTYLEGAIQINDIDQLQDNSLILAGKGWYSGEGQCSPYYRNVLMRLTQEGVLSNNFSENGSIQYLTGNCVSEADRIFIQADNKILIGGNGSSIFDGEEIEALALSRVDANGIPDESFANEGYHLFNSYIERNSCIEIGLQSDGKIIMVSDGGYGGRGYFILLRADAGLPAPEIIEHEDGKTDIWSFNKTIFITNNETVDANCYVFNALGQVVRAFYAPPGQSSYTIPELPAGWYIVSIQKQIGIENYKLLFTN